MILRNKSSGMMNSKNNLLWKDHSYNQIGTIKTLCRIETQIWVPEIGRVSMWSTNFISHRILYRALGKAQQYGTVED